LEKSRLEWESLGNFKENHVIEIPHELIFLVSLLRVMSVGTEGLNAVTEVKCQSLLTIKHLIAMLKLSDFHYLLKFNLLYFFIQAHLDIEKSLN
jgi:hypothetical protein